MKGTVVAGAAAIVAAAFALHCSEPPDSSPRTLRARTAPQDPEISDSLVPPDPRAEPPAAPAARTVAAVEPKIAPVAPEEEAEDAQALLREKLSLLEGDLGLSRQQMLFIESVWRERDAEIAALHADIRASKVLWIWGHDKRAREILAASHARIAAGLSPEQSQRFFAILESGRLAEGVSFRVTPDITVVQ